MKTIVGIIAGLALFAVLAGYYIFVPHMEKQSADQIAAFLEALPGELKADAISVKLLENKVEILGLNGLAVYTDGSEIDVDIEKIVLSAFHFSLLNTPGRARIVDDLEVTNGKIRTQTRVEGMEEPLVQSIECEHILLRDLTGDIHALNLLVKSGAPNSRIADCLAAFSAGSLQVSGYSNTAETFIGFMNVKIASFSGKDMTLLHSGESSWTDIHCSAFGSDVLSVGRISLAGYSAPNVLVPFFEALENGTGEDLSETIIKLTEKEPFVLRDLTLEDFFFHFPLAEEVTAKEILVNAHAAGKLTLNSKVKTLAVPAAVYRHLSLEAAQFAEYYEKPLLLDMNVDLETTRKDGKGGFSLKECTLSDPALFFLSLSLDLLYGAGAQDQDPADGAGAFFKKATIVFEDKGLLDNLFAGEFAALEAFGLDGDSIKGPADLRSQMAQRMREQIEEAGGNDEKLLLRGLADLLDAPGRLRVSLNPGEPVQLSREMEVLPELNAQVQYEPAPAVPPQAE